MKRLLLALFLTACSVQQPEIRSVEIAAATTPGYDVLGLAKYCDIFLRAPTLPAVSTLLTTFGNPFRCIERAILQGGISTVQIDVRDATCFRNHVCPPGTPPLTDWSFLLGRAKAVNRYVVKYPLINWWISPFLEHDFRDPAVIRKACQVVKQGCPTCKCINSPFSGARPNEIPLELHGTKVRAFSISGDGASTFDADNILNDGNNFQHRIAGRDQSYSWWNELNLRCTGEEDFVPVDERTVRPELWQFRMAHKIMTSVEDPIPPVPPQCRTVRRVRAPEINKPLAERYCNGEKDDGRGNKPLLILKKRGQPGQGLPILTSSGKQIGCFRYYGPFTQSSLFRWYVGTCSRGNAWELYRESGSEWAYALLGRNDCLLFNLLRREGVYR